MTDKIPEQVQELIDMAISSVSKVIGVAPDLTPDTLPITDQYIRQFPAEAPAEVRTLAISAAGCYFGEVVRRSLNGHWKLAGLSPDRWRVELKNCYLHFSPVGMVGEVLVGKESPEFDGSFDLPPEHKERLKTRLSKTTQIGEDEYFSLSGRFDILQLVASWLTELRET